MFCLFLLLSPPSPAPSAALLAHTPSTGFSPASSPQWPRSLLQRPERPGGGAALPLAFLELLHRLHMARRAFPGVGRWRMSPPALHPLLLAARSRRPPRMRSRHPPALIGPLPLLGASPGPRTSKRKRSIASARARTITITSAQPTYNTEFKHE